MENYEKVLSKLLSRSKYHFHIRELAKETGLNPNTISSITDRLKEESIVKKEKGKMVVEVYCNLGAKEYQRKKKIFDIEILYKVGLVDFLIEKCNPRSIVLIKEREVIMVSEKKNVGNLEKYEEILGGKLDLISVKKVNKEILSKMINGFVLYGEVGGAK